MKITMDLIDTLIVAVEDAIVDADEDLNAGEMKVKVLESLDNVSTELQYIARTLRGL
jgi:hypothetical protein